MKERCGLNKSSFDRIAEKAYREGISHKETKGNLNKWVTSLYFYDETANNIKLYGDKAYLFKGDKLITVLSIPHDLQPAVNKIKKNKKEKSIGSN